jgi:hypothetical protein
VPEEEANPDSAQVVEKTGLAVVHKGERIEAAATSKAVTKSVLAHSDAFHFEFPIEVIAVGNVPDTTKQEIADQIWADLHDALG